MDLKKTVPDESIAFIVKDILHVKSLGNPAKTMLPFFADGYPGLVFHVTPEGQWVQPHNRRMPPAYLYGQTLHPVELHIQGSYTLIIFQLYPIVINGLFGLDAKTLNNGCYDLQKTAGWDSIETALFEEKDIRQQIRIISRYLHNLFYTRRQNLDLALKNSIQLILNAKAQITVKALCEKLHLTPRTFERRFSKEVGISAKDFIQITKFQLSFERLSVKDYTYLSDIAYENGFADQSHFIRVFKAFTGATPSAFEKKNTPKLL